MSLQSYIANFLIPNWRQTQKLYQVQHEVAEWYHKEAHFIPNFTLYHAPANGSWKNHPANQANIFLWNKFESFTFNGGTIVICLVSDTKGWVFNGEAGMWLGGDYVLVDGVDPFSIAHELAHRLQNRSTHDPMGSNTILDVNSVHNWPDVRWM